LVAGLESSLSGLLPGTLFECRATWCRAILAVSAGQERVATDALRRVSARVTGGNGELITVGLSNVCRGRDSFPRAFSEAASAAEVGPLVNGGPGIYTYEDLGLYRYLLHGDSGSSDRHQDQLERLVEYDSRRGSELLHTLEVYLEGRGNVVGTARTLHTHPNTLRQRLARIEALSGLSLEAEDWLALGIAIKLVKLRQARRAARQEEGVPRG
jgi:DNA-binding PucR family transcriptional regulator